MRLIATAIVLMICAAAPLAAGELDEAFISATNASMMKMMDGMAIKPSGDVDQDFVAMMIPHHQGAIDMAVLELRYGRNVRLQRLAQEIVITQQEEIVAMKLAVDGPMQKSTLSPNSSPAP